MEEVAQRSCQCPIPESIQGQTGWGFQQPGLMETVPATAGNWNWMIFQVPPNPNYSFSLLFYEMYYEKAISKHFYFGITILFSLSLFF